MKTKHIVIGCICLSLAAIGCSQVSRSVGSVTDNLYAQQTHTAPKTTFVSADGRIQVTTPTTWRDTFSENNQPNMVLHIQRESNQLQMGIQAFAKAEHPHMTPSLHAEAAASMVKTVTGAATTPEKRELTTINGLPAAHYQGRGEFMGHRMAATGTAVEGADAYYLILVVGYESDFDQLQSEVDQMIQSFQEVTKTSAIQSP